MLVEGQSSTERKGRTADRTGSEQANVLLIHGLGSRGSDLSRVADGLSGNEIVAMPDLRGHGQSPPGPAGQLEDFAVDLLPLIDEHEQLLVGASFGAWVALALWRMRPERVTGVILVDPPLTYGPLFEWASRGGTHGHPDRQSRERILGKLTAVYHSRDEHEAVNLMKEHPLTMHLNDADRASNARSLMAADRPTLLAGLALVNRPEDQMRPPNSGVVPVILFGDQSSLTGPERSQLFAEGIGGRTVSYHGGHVAHFEAPTEVAACIQQVLGSDESYEIAVR